MMGAVSVLLVGASMGNPAIEVRCALRLGSFAFSGGAVWLLYRLAKTTELGSSTDPTKEKESVASAAHAHVCSSLSDARQEYFYHNFLIQLQDRPLGIRILGLKITFEVVIRAGLRLC